MSLTGACGGWSVARDVAVRPWHLLSLCDGYGGTELALRSVARVRTVARVERDAYAAAVLVERMGEARLDRCPVWDDVATFDGRPWRGRVDIVAAGFPCQPFSAAGRRAGVDDARWLWPDIARIVADVRPGLVLLENVGQLVAHGLPEVLCSLAGLGFDAEWGLLAASAVGAPHKRERLWIVAWRDGDGCLRERTPEPWSGRVPAIDADRCCAVVGHTDGERRTAQSSSSSSKGSDAGRGADRAHVADCAVETVGNAASGRCVQGHRPSTRQRWTDGIEATVGWPPGRDDGDGWQRWIAAGGPEPVLRRRTDGPPVGLADALHLGGNGLVPQCAAHAWGQLLERGGWLT